MSDASPPPRAPATIAPAETPGLESLMTLAVAVVVVAALYLAREVLVPITVAILLTFVLVPVVEFLRKIHVPHVAAVLLAVVIGVGVILSLGSVIGVQLADLASDIPRYATTIETKLQTIQGATLGRLASLTNRLDRQMAHSGPVETSAAPKPPTAAPSGSQQPPSSTPADAGASLGTPAGAVTPKPIPVEIHQPTADPLTLARNILEPILAPISNTLIIIIIATFILMQREDLRDRLIRLFGSNDLHRTTVAMDDAGRRLGRFFLAQLGINTAFGVIISIGLAIIGVPSPVLWGVLSALLRFVPYIGPVIAGLLPAALAAAVSPGWSMVVWTVGLFVAAESVTGQVVEPMVYGHATGLSPAAVVIAAIFWTWIWGPIGLVLSTPLTLCLVVLGRHVDRLEFLDVLLGDRPALTPVENFYQRMLANDPDEALDQAEVLLKERSLTAYYDEVALKGLQLAANDSTRGVLGPAKLDFIKDSVRSLIADLASHEDRDPHDHEKEESAAIATRAEKALPSPLAPAEDAPAAHRLADDWQGPAPILCLAGRGPLDEAASSMLAQLLGKHGLGARVLPHQAASREGIGTLDPAGVKMVCLSYLDISGSPSNLHYLMRRLRQRLPGVQILVGLWPSEEEALDDKRIRSIIGADHYTTSLKEAVDICVKAAQTASDADPVPHPGSRAAEPQATGAAPVAVA